MTERTGWEFNVCKAERGENPWSNRATHKTLNTSALEDVARYMRELAHGDAPRFIRPSFAPVPASWYAMLCELETLDRWATLYPELASIEWHWGPL